MNKTLFISALCLASQFAHADLVVPNTFTANTPAKASEVNANFNAVTTFVNSLTRNVASINARKVTTTDAGGVGVASCAVTEVVVGGGCVCTGNTSSGTNYGVLFACRPIGNSYIGACYNHLHNSALPDSPIDVNVICMRTPTVIGATIQSATGATIQSAGADAGVDQPDTEASAALQKLKAMQIDQQRK